MTKPTTPTKYIVLKCYNGMRFVVCRTDDLRLAQGRVRDIEAEAEVRKQARKPGARPTAELYALVVVQ